tara:strand:+ start:756 stop:1199 length:444 start_codon:yes stop_codon:yes gene_type:complete
MSHRRLKHEFRELKNDTDLQCNVLSSDSIYNWKILMKGPKGTPYENGRFLLDILISSDHPFKPPIITSRTQIFHPNISVSGDICIDILKEKWSPVLTMTKVILSLQSLLGDPNPNDPLDQESADLYIHDKDAYIKKAKLWTKLYACI